MSNLFKKVSVAAVLFIAGATAARAQVSFVNPLTGDKGPGGKSLGEMISGVMGFFLWVAIIVCPALILWGALLIATSGGSEEKPAGPAIHHLRGGGVGDYFAFQCHQSDYF